MSNEQLAAIRRAALENEMEAQAEREGSALKSSNQWRRGRRHFCTKKEQQAQKAREFFGKL